MDQQTAQRVIDLLDQRLVALADLALTLKHVHWNVVGPNFIAVHEMLDDHVAQVRLMVDAVAERIATLGGVPVGTPGHLAKQRTWDDYSVGRADVREHLAALDVVYVGVIRDHRAAIQELDELDLVSQGILLAQAELLEQYQWFVRAHLEDRDGNLSHEGEATERGAARAAR
ncbi:MAG TPA: DNA starvation/stationary phase protection protein [Egibacteraceae bacterium]|nr:DNA starvation/stationary phase protection protein [Egibacteraceae bacterium]